MGQSQRIALAAQQTGRTPVTMDYEWAMINSAHAFWWIAENDYTQYSLGLMGDEI